MKDTISAFLKGGNYLKPEQRSLFVMVAKRALNPKSKLAVENWMAAEAVVSELAEIHVTGET